MAEIGRKRPPHHWDHEVQGGSLREVYMITICCRERNSNQLAIPRVWRGIRETLIWRQAANHIVCDLALAMPDHFHALLSFVERDMQSEIRSIKAWLAKAYQIRWQRDFFDHRIRSWECGKEKADYIRMNPVRANLVSNTVDWPYQM